MKPLGVNRVVIAVKDLDSATSFYSQLLSAIFYDASAGAESFGVRAAISWDSGIELVAPIPGRDSFIARLIEKRGEGLQGVVFAVDDVEEAKAKAEKMGIGVIQTIEFKGEQLKKLFGGRFTKFKEYILNPTNTGGIQVVLGQFDTAKPSSDASEVRTCYDLI